MNINSVGVYNPISYGSKKINLKEVIKSKPAAAALAALLLINPLGSKNKAQADNTSSQTVTYTTQTSLDDYRIVPNSDLYYAVLNSNGQYKIDIHYTPGENNGAYYQYGNEIFDVEGNKIVNSEQSKAVIIYEEQAAAPVVQTTGTTEVIAVTNHQKTDFERLYSIYKDTYKVEERYDARVGTYYTYAGKNFDEYGNMISLPVPDYIQNQSDLDKLYAQYGDKYKLEVKYNEKIGSYYLYAGRTFSIDGKEITVPKEEPKQNLTDYDKLYATYGDRYETEVKYSEKVGYYYLYAGRTFALDGREITIPKDKPVTPTPCPVPPADASKTDFDRYYEAYGNRYDVEVKYNEKIGYYYSYAGRNFSLEGKEICVSQSSSSKSSGSSGSSAKKTSNPRVKAGSDFEKYYLQYGNKYEIKSHWDHKEGSYYQYGPYAFTQDGKYISNPEKLYHFDTNVK